MEVIVPLISAVIRVYPESCIHFWGEFSRGPTASSGVWNICPLRRGCETEVAHPGSALRVLTNSPQPRGKATKELEPGGEWWGMRNCEWKLKVKRFREKVRRPFPPWDSWAGGCIAQGNCAGSILGVFWSTKGHSSKQPDVGPEATLSKQKDALETSSLAFPYKYPYDLEILYK